MRSVFAIHFFQNIETSFDEGSETAKETDVSGFRFSSVANRRAGFASKEGDCSLKIVS